MSPPDYGWQTDELGEEWPESSPSPPTLPSALPPLEKLTYNAESIKAKRGSLRMLGQASARPLPLSRSVSVNSQGERIPSRIVSGHVDGGKGHLSSPGHGLDDHGIPSPPSSRSSSDAGGLALNAAGTCVVKEGVDDDRGAHLARNPMGPGKGGKDIFGALPLERMFDPPSPPSVAAVDQPPISEYSAVSTPTPAAQPVTTEPRRVSHQYAPVHPSRLSKSVTPSSNDSFTTISSIAPTPELQQEAFDGEPDSLIRDSTVIRDGDEDSALPGDFYTATQGDEMHNKDYRLGEMSLRSGEVETDMSPIGRQASSNYPFTFNAPRLPSTSNAPQVASPGLFDPSLEAAGDGPSHSTLNLRSQPRAKENNLRSAQQAETNTRQSSNPALRLFRSTYDTYTREHLSALVDSIAIEPSPSPPSMPNAHHLREWSPAADNSASPSASGPSSTPSSSSLSSDARSSKRLRLSPPSPPKRAIGLRDWGAHGRAMMDKIRGQEPEESATSASHSRASGSESQEQNFDDGPTVDYATLPPTPPLEMAPVTRTLPIQPTHRSNPSTTSSGYLRAAEDIMARIKSRKVSESASGVENSPVTIGSRRVLSESDENQMWEEQAERYAKTKGKARAGPSPRRMLRRLSASEEVKKVAEADSGSGDDQPMSSSSGSSVRQQRAQLQETRRPTSVASGTSSHSAPQPPIQAQGRFTADDLNRFMSSSTHPTSSTISTSFVKHRGPRAVAPGKGIRMIRPDEVQGLMPDRIGKMVYDKVSRRWVRDTLDRVDEAGESRVGGSEESVDVFAGMESLPEDGSPQHDIVEGEDDVSSFSSSMEDIVQHHANQTLHEVSGSESDIDEPEEQTITAPATVRISPARPVIHHATSAPAVMTPLPSAHAPRPIRSALRNTLTPAGAFKKRTGWSDEITPAGRNSLTPRSVSFSDGKKAGKIVGLEVSIRATTTKWSMQEDDLFKEGEGSRSFLPSARTKRIQGLLEDMEDLSLAEETPSKPSRNADRSNSISADSESTVPIRSFRQGGGGLANRSSGRNMADATFLTECSFGVAHDKLVQLITDVQPFEPHWEDLKMIELRGKGVDSVARLKEFLPKLDEINLIDNVISYLSGIPSTVRTLHVAQNRLTSLTSVNHLRNLQYLDISRNQLDSLSQLECLSHLRELKADHNIITDLSGIMGMDSLIKLSVSNNRISQVDFTSAKWNKMESLTLSNNKTVSVRELHKLSGVTLLNFDGNRLESLTPAKPMPSVRVLRLSDNDISHFDISLFPKVRTLYADGNSLSHLSRSSPSSARLENLSLRNQRLGSKVQLELRYPDLENVKRLYLSGNALSSEFFSVNRPLYALFYLEAAACKLSSWPKNLSENLPNLKVLNVNYNYLTDLDGIKGMKGLRKITLVGGRLGAGEKGEVGKGVMLGLKGMDRLEEVDFRMNPCTLSYYFPLLLPTSKEKEEDGTNFEPPEMKRPHIPAIDISRIAPIPSAPPTTWTTYDSRFRKNLPDEWYSKRLLYRGLIMRQCQSLRKLDGYDVEDGERKKAGDLLKAALERV